jgi:hypothetical protein
MRTFYTHLTLIVGGLGLLAACSDERVPRSTLEFLENPIMLEAAMVRCSQDRAATRYDAECINARQAVQQIEAKEEAARKVDRERRSESKRQSLRRTQEAASQARRRAAENERLRKEAEYLAQFGVAPPMNDGTMDDEPEIGNLPLADIPEGPEQQPMTSGPGDVVQATDGGNAPGSAVQPKEEESQTDLDSIRDELQRRNDEEGN